MRTLLAACCLVGLVLGGALAPAVGIGTPVPDLGVEDGGEAGGGTSFGDADEGIGSDDVFGNGSDDLGVESYGGVTAGGYPDRATVGGRLELSDHEAFRVESPEPRRWRLGAYARYTGDGWERNATRPEPLTSPLPTVLNDRTRPQYEVRVTALRPFEGLISPWRPAFAAAGDNRVLVDRERALTVENRIETGDEYTTFTYGRISRETAAVASDGDYPNDIEARYTQLPADTPERLGNRTAEITEDAETPFEAAVEVEDWLEDNKEYSLNATHDRGDDIATQFVFEMEAGYCQYFATTMVAMLRTQGIPARYVTGYGPGEPVGDDEYLVRGEDAHAWVEVYVADVGWVTFDPTPAEERAEAGRDARSLDDLGEDWTPDDGDNDTLDIPTATDDGPRPTTVTLTADPVPGRRASAVVTQDDRPVRSTPVTFNGRDVGRTNRAGAVAGAVPYTDSLIVDVRLESQPARFGADGAPGRQITRRTGSATGNAQVAFDLPTEITVEVLGDPEPGGRIEIVAALSEAPVENATVAVDGRRVGRTDEQGAATLSLPDGETAEITVERGDAAGNRTLSLVSANDSEAVAAEASGDLNVSVTPQFPVALPATPATVDVTYRGEPVSNATVVVDGEAVGATDPEGALGVRLPLAEPVTVTATVPINGSAGGSGGDGGPFGDRGAGIEASTLTGTATVDGVRRNTGGAVAVLVFAAVALGGVARRRELTVHGSARSARRGAAGTLRRAVGSLVGLADAVDAGVAGLLKRGRRVAGLLGDGPEGIAVLLGETADALLGIALAAGGLIRRFGPRALLAAVRSEEPPSRTADADPATTVREAWTELRDHVTVPSWRTSTPGEIARWAISRDGLPEEAVATLRDAFREVEYGAGNAEERATEVREALEEIRTETTGGDEPEVADD
ncbi:transglutaminase domain-containing protein [Natronomonas marina]|uniref:transglutaminase family protein n=1 Tax=Natronomonas marina TaxID=2961939 RepID=UPI0020C99815|nr:transglutaminase domain-containing protein [Natronomonas marina]